MPNKTIYVSDADLSVFDKAQQMAGGNLSSAISQALRRFVEDNSMQDLEDEGFEEVSVEVGRVYRVGNRFIREANIEKRFIGKPVISWRTSDPQEPRGESYEVYLTPKGRYAIYSKTGPNHDYEGDIEWEDTSKESRLDVYDSLEEIRASLPPELYEATVQAAAESAGYGEFLDI